MDHCPVNFNNEDLYGQRKEKCSHFWLSLKSANLSNVGEEGIERERGEEISAGWRVKRFIAIAGLTQKASQTIGLLLLWSSALTCSYGNGVSQGGHGSCWATLSPANQNQRSGYPCFTDHWSQRFLFWSGTKLHSFVMLIRTLYPSPPPLIYTFRVDGALKAKCLWREEQLPPGMPWVTWPWPSHGRLCARRGPVREQLLVGAAQL